MGSCHFEVKPHTAVPCPDNPLSLPRPIAAALGSGATYRQGWGCALQSYLQPFALLNNFTSGLWSSRSWGTKARECTVWPPLGSQFKASLVAPGRGSEPGKRNYSTRELQTPVGGRRCYQLYSPTWGSPEPLKTNKAVTFRIKLWRSALGWEKKLVPLIHKIAFSYFAESSHMYVLAGLDIFKNTQPNNYA